MNYSIDCIVRASDTLSDGFFHLSLEPVRKISKIVPGQFVMVRCAAQLDPFLRRPMSIADFEPDGSRFGLLIKQVGKGTRYLAGLAPWSSLDVMGPYGQGFTVPEGVRKIWIVAGGSGVAPFLGLLANSPKGAYEHTVFLGAKNESELLYLNRLEKHARVITATEDGSHGFSGYVTEPFSTEISGGARPDIIFTCGPTPMMKKVAQLAEELGIPCQVSLENSMACGFGACLGCVVKARGQDKYLTVCKNGPVFDALRIEL
ncbi:MAG: dihydroorotate dehydrogenase electron transfer subunit [Nitrospinae bacterium]|nr:dihydroorotate dehydrogenase electron transfer subunit [Nitrospinota bacterium]